MGIKKKIKAVIFYFYSNTALGILTSPGSHAFVTKDN